MYTALEVDVCLSLKTHDSLPTTTAAGRATQQGAHTFIGLVASRVTTSMTALSVHPSLKA